MNQKVRVLLIEDDVNLAFMLTDGLELENFTVSHIVRGEEALAKLEIFEPDIILLDVNLKGKVDGFEVGKKIRQKSRIPIIFTTARTQIEDMQEGYKIGNVDYLKKPYGVRELVLRINEILSKNRDKFTPIESEPDSYILNNCRFFPNEHCLIINEDKIRLPKNECAVLLLLCKNRGKVLKKSEIIELVWKGEDIKSKEPSLDNILLSLRTKFRELSHVEIQTIPKQGYILLDRKDV